jgi:uncharacterized protein (TIGR02996 family)
MHNDFLDVLRTNPNDNVTRLVYADWLDEQDDPLAEFLRLEVRLAANEVPEAERLSARNRLAELGRRAEPRWLCAVNREPFVWCAVRKSSGGDPRHGKVELVTYSTRAMLITFDTHLLQHLRLDVTDPLGASSDTWYDQATTALGVARTHRLEVASKLSLTMNLLHGVAVPEIMTGAYTVEARYEYDGVVSRADPVRLELTEEDRRRWKLGRFARE